MELWPDSPRKYVHLRPVNDCAQCGAHIFMPEWSEPFDARRVRHLWQCDACGYQFETLVYLPSA